MDMTSIIAAAAGAAGLAPADTPDYQEWRGRVLSIASDLAAMVEGHEGREKRKQGIHPSYDPNDKVTAFHAKLVKVEKIVKGQGENTVTKGRLFLEAHQSSNVNEEGFETIETAPLGTPEGDEEYVRAQALVGRNVTIYKRNFLHPTDKSKKLKELVAVDAASGFATDSQPSTQSTPQAPTPSEPRVPQPELSPEEENREAIRAELNTLTKEERTTFLQFLEAEGLPSKVDAWDAAALETVEGWLRS